jgi:AbrB family looped-hinge helix DNA binding protein
MADPVEKTKEQCCGISKDSASGRYRVEALIAVDERGQTVLPKEVREKAGIKAGDKLAVMTWEKDGRVCCLFLIKASELAGMARDFLGPLARDFVENKG